MLGFSLTEETVAQKHEDRMLPLMTNSIPVCNLRTLEAQRFTVMIFRFNGRVYSFPIRELARMNQFSFYEQPFLMECELLIPVEPAKDYDKLLMFKKSKGTPP